MQTREIDTLRINGVLTREMIAGQLGMERYEDVANIGVELCKWVAGITRRKMRM